MTSSISSSSSSPGTHRKELRHKKQERRDKSNVPREPEERPPYILTKGKILLWTFAQTISDELMSTEIVTYKTTYSLVLLDSFKMEQDGREDAVNRIWLLTPDP